MALREVGNDLVRFLRKMIDDGRAADVVYMDSGKTFNKFPHGRLILKIKIHGSKVTWWIGFKIDLSTEDRGSV